MITTGISSPWTTSTGRLFDAVAALLGICLTNDHEAQAAMALEAAAWSAPESADDAAHASDNLFAIIPAEPGLPGAPWQLDLSPFIRHIAQRGSLPLDEAAKLARYFHHKLAEGFWALAKRAQTMTDRAQTGANRDQTEADRAPKKPTLLPLVASGGVFCNRLLEQKLAHFSAKNSSDSTFFHELYPTTDAGLAFGQAIYSQRIH
jgi:hydrogenase maturation protein HypF